MKTFLRIKVRELFPSLKLNFFPSFRYIVRTPSRNAITRLSIIFRIKLFPFQLLPALLWIPHWIYFPLTRWNITALVTNIKPARTRVHESGKRKTGSENSRGVTMHNDQQFDSMIDAPFVPIVPFQRNVCSLPVQIIAEYFDRKFHFSFY